MPKSERDIAQNTGPMGSTQSSQSLEHGILDLHREKAQKAIVNTIRKHFDSLNPEELFSLCYGGVSDEYTHFLYSCLSLFIGEKPAIMLEVPSDYEVVFSFLTPPQLKDRFVKTSGLWVYDKALVRNVITKYSVYFSDFDFTKIDNDEYLLKYMNGVANKSGKRDDYEFARERLLLGYPAATALVRINKRSKSLKKFESHIFGFNASLTQEDADELRGRLGEVYERTGLSKLITDLQQKARKHFEQKVRKAKNEWKLITHNGLIFLELSQVDKKALKMTKNLVLVSNSTSLGDFQKLIKFFSEKYSMDSFQDAHSIGFLNTSDTFQENWPDGSNLMHYFEIRYTSDKLHPSISIKHIEKNKMINYLEEFWPDTAVAVKGVLKD